MVAQPCNLEGVITLGIWPVLCCVLCLLWIESSVKALLSNSGLCATWIFLKSCLLQSDD